MSVEVVTFGCRLNAFESEVVRLQAASAGLADTIIINSCAVTGEAVAQARQSIRVHAAASGDLRQKVCHAIDHRQARRDSAMRRLYCDF